MTTSAMAELERLGSGGTLRVAAWLRARETGGYDPRSAYVERFWLPVLGPSTVFLLRHLAAVLEGAPGGRLIDVSATARAIGLGDRRGRNAPFLRTVARAVEWEMAQLGPGCLLVRRRLPPLARRQVARLPEPLRSEHVLLARRSPAPGAPPCGLEERVRQLARRAADDGRPRPTGCQALAFPPPGA